MDKDTILNYVTETPGNTNRAVLKGMLDSLDGGIEMVTLFDDDINITNYSSGTQYGPAHGTGFGDFLDSAIEDGIIKVTYENKNAFGIYVKTSTPSGANFSASVQVMESPVGTFQIGPYSSINSFYFTINSLNSNVESEFEAYCQESHHLKVEWFTV